MRLWTKTFAYGVAGIVVAGAVLSTGSALGFISLSTSGDLSVMLTDPPSVPAGVSAIYLTYTNLGVHPKGFANSTWVSIAGGGTIDTMKLINLSQTISTDTVPSLTYDLMKFNISGVNVEYFAKNYTAAVSSGSLTAPILGGLVVNSSNLAAALVDLQPTVLNLGNQSGPEFTITAGAKALQVPSGQVSDSVKQVGHTTSLKGHGWFQSFESVHSDDLSVSGVLLSSNSLSFSATNDGSDPFTIRMVVVAQSAQGNGVGNSLGAIVNGAVFTVHPNESLQLLNGPPGQVEALLAGPGCTLAPGRSHEFNFSGEITTLLGDRGITAGGTYYVVVIGYGEVAVQSVASP